MSDYYIRFIPDAPYYELNSNEIADIKSFVWYGDNVQINVSATLLFADAGANFESVNCPFCKTDLMDWWGGAMNEAYSNNEGFTDINIFTPCCNRATTLHNLDYFFDQGFYKSIVEIKPELIHSIDDKQICEQLRGVTNTSWRVIHNRI